MSEEQLTALLAKLNEDSELRAKFQTAAGIDAVLALAKEAGFDVSQADWLNHQAQKELQLDSSELEMIAGGAGANDGTNSNNPKMIRTCCNNTENVYDGKC